ncbi:MAG: sodium:proline symporter, partial [Clostridia bacterium]|nr:sodium:proline symporter [Clostridia bacterium]
GYCGMPHILVRFMAIKEAKMLTKSRRIATIWVVISLFCSCIIGLLGRLYLGGDALTKATSETVFIVLADRLMPSFIAGIIISAILAAIMSTADSQLLVVASSVSSDILPKLYKKEVSEKGLVWISRVTIIIVSVIACIIALDKDSSIMGLVSYAWAGFGSAFGPCVLLSLYWKRFTYKGALVSMVVGGLTVIIWETVGSPMGLYSLAPGFVLAFIAGVVMTLMDKEPSDEIKAEFDEVQRKFKEA